MMFGFAIPSRQPCGSLPGPAPEEHCRAHPGSEERSQDLLRQWLSSDQIEQYDLCLYFNVVGSATGTRYRIRRGRAMNIEELAADGCVTRRWCFAPYGTFATGDIMLAQKIALETFELEALAIANHDGPRRAGFPHQPIGLPDRQGQAGRRHIDEPCWLLLAFACLGMVVWLFYNIAY
jgi:hypothetical protein